MQVLIDLALHVPLAIAYVAGLVSGLLVWWLCDLERGPR